MERNQILQRDLYDLGDVVSIVRKYDYYFHNQIIQTYIAKDNIFSILYY